MLDKQILEANLIKLLGLELLPLEKKVKILGQAAELVQKRLLTSLLGQLTEQEKEKFLNLLATEGKEQEKENFIHQRFPNLNQLMDEEIIKIKSELLDATVV